MKTHFVVTITCPDRPGIVERVTEVVAEHAANWEESRLARLGGDFAGIVRVSVPQEHAAALSSALRELTNEQMTVTVRTSHSPAAVFSVSGHRLCALRLTGADHEGIVHAVSAYLASQQINVEAMDTQVVPAPVSAAPLFHMDAQIRIPPGLSLPELDANLQRIGEELGVDIDVRPIE
jgi:glycine cleavage system regulatory protein